MTEATPSWPALQHDGPWITPAAPKWEVTLWIQGKGANAVHLYGCATPVVDPWPHWSTKRFKNPRPERRRLQIGADAARIETLLREIRNGATLGAASQSAGLPTPTGSDPSIVVVRDPTAWVRAPSHFAPPRPDGGRSRWATSPSYYAATVVDALVPADKGPLLVGFRDDQLLYTLGQLSGEVGLDFTANGFQRIGNLEVLHPLLRATSDGASEGARFEAREGCFTMSIPTDDSSSSYLLRCRQVVGGLIVRDDLVPLQTAHGRAVGRIDAHSVDTELLLAEVWQRRGPHHVLVWSNESRFIPLRPAPKPHEPSEPVPVLRDQRRQLNALRVNRLPDEDGSVFFDKMVGERDPRPRAELLHWLKHQARSASEVLLVDPYFENDALELLLRLPDGCHTRTVLTSRKARDTDDEGAPQQTKGITVLAKLWRDCEAARREGRRVPRVLVDRSGKLHDRYIVFTDSSGRRQGFHLSNSLQNATKRHPLLVTPIGPSSLARVYKYVQSRLTAAQPIDSYLASQQPAAASVDERPPQAPSVEARAAAVEDALTGLSSLTGSTLVAAWIRAANALAHMPLTHTDPLQRRVREELSALGVERFWRTLTDAPHDLLDARSGADQDAYVLTRACASRSFEQVYDNLRPNQEFDGWPSGSPWPLGYAARFVAALDVCELTRWSEYVNELHTPAQDMSFVLVHLMQQVLNHSFELEGSDDAVRRERGAATDIFLRSKCTWVRAFASRCVTWHAPLSVADRDRLLVLPDDELLHVLEYVVRVHLGDGLDNELLRTSAQMLVDRWPERRPVDRIWGGSRFRLLPYLRQLDTLVVAPLQARRRASRATTWQSVMCDVMGRMLDSTSGWFVHDVDVMFALSELVVDSVTDGQALPDRFIEDELGEVKRILRHPFARTRDLGAHRAATTVLRWGAGTARLLASRRPLGSAPSPLAEWIRAERLLLPELHTEHTLAEYDLFFAAQEIARRCAEAEQS